MEATDPQNIIVCVQEGCTVNLDGKCLEGFSDPTECPHFDIRQKQNGRNTDVLTETQPAENLKARPREPKRQKEIVSLFSGEPLSLEATRKITQARPATLIAITGALGSGKTTLLGYLNNHFQIATSYGGYVFAGSYTLLALEERSHMARAASMREEPDTPRTSFLEGTHCVHLRLSRLNDDCTLTELLLADASGEYYEKSISDSERLLELEALQQAKRVVLLLDGAKIADLTERQVVGRDADNFIRRCLENDIFNEETTLDVVFAKWDRIQGGNAGDFVEHIEREIRKRYDRRLSNLAIHRIAARSEVDDIEAGFGVESLFTSWFPTEAPPQPVTYQPVVKLEDREFVRLVERPISSIR